jgi:uncharacterized protein YceH (UPF0502 family)
MSDEATQPGSAGPWPVLDTQERRVLGVLIEKGKTTPDAYPLSLNALVTGCNQKSNREPIMELDDADVEEAMVRCKNRGLAAKVVGGRVERWRHLLYEAWGLDKVTIAIIAELLLRGPQTEGELRGRASRMEPIEDLDALRGHLHGLAERNLVVYLTPEERRGAMVTHGFHDPAELARLKARFASGIPTAPAAATPPAPRVEERASAGQDQALAALREEVQASRQRIAALEQAVGELRGQLAGAREELRALKQSLGG